MADQTPRTAAFGVISHALQDALPSRDGDMLLRQAAAIERSITDQGWTLVRAEARARDDYDTDGIGELPGPDILLERARQELNDRQTTEGSR